MGRKSTKRDEILQFINTFVLDHGYAPTIREIMRAVGLHSTASVQYHLDALKNDGVIAVESSKKRAISLAVHPGQVPVVGVVTAGQPILAVENIEGYLPWDGEEDCFALRVRGESMINAGILDGDRVIVRPQATAENGEIVVALLGDEATVKRFQRKNGKVWLMPENPDYTPIDGTYATILGKVKAVIRYY